MSMGKIQDRIKKMKEAIQSQAKQRAMQIVERAEEEADIERNNIIKHEKEKIDAQFMKLNQAEKTKAKIEKSSVVNKHRLLKMQQRYKFVEELKEELKQKLRAVMSNDTQAKNITQSLIVQGMLRMMEKNVLIEASENQKNFIQQILPYCQQQFTEIIKNQTGKDTQATLNVSEYSLESKQKNIIGGVFLRSQDGLIVCDNSLDARVELVFEQLLPQIRTWLFPKQPIHNGRSAYENSNGVHTRTAPQPITNQYVPPIRR